MTARIALTLGMFIAIALVAVGLLVDEQREFEAAVDDLKDEQVAIATAVAADFEMRLERLVQAHPEALDASDVGRRIPELLGGATKLEQPGARVLLVARPDRGLLFTSRGTPLGSEALATALAAGELGTVLTRMEAPRFGLPPRIAIAGIALVSPRSGTWGVVVITSGERLRARERYAQMRFLLGLGLVLAIIGGFGAMAIRQERRQAKAARALEHSAIEREREKLLAKADKMATLAALSSGIAHEVATPLSTIMARAEQLFIAHEADAESRAAVEVVLEQVTRIRSIIRGVLGLARGEMPPFVAADPTELVRAAVAVSLHRFTQAGVRVALETGPDLPRIACDPPMLEQALTNVLINACDASAPGTTVYLRAHATASTLTFVVDDEGEGITKEAAARAQEPFFTTKTGIRGNGLGLAITREIVSHHGGSLRLEPRSDARGARATIELPAAGERSSE